MLVSHRHLRGNVILSSLPGDAYACLEPLLKPVEFRQRQCVEAASKNIERVVFPFRGLLSAVAVSRNRRHETEVGVIGREGMTGASLLLGADRASLDIFVLMEGDGYCVCAKELRRLADEHPAIRTSFLKYLHTFFIQIARTALANSRASLDQRVARWLLIAHDRVGDELQLTHELLALMLGVRRAGVTTAINQLERLGLIEASRGLIVIIDRKGIEEHCQGFYGQAERESTRWLPPLSAVNEVI